MIDFVLNVLAWSFFILVIIPIGLGIVLVPPLMLIEWLIALSDRIDKRKLE